MPCGKRGTDDERWGGRGKGGQKGFQEVREVGWEGGEPAQLQALHSQKNLGPRSSENFSNMLLLLCGKKNSNTSVLSSGTSSKLQHLYLGRTERMLWTPPGLSGVS